jgi:hypothetical protein
MDIEKKKENVSYYYPGNKLKIITVLKIVGSMVSVLCK